MILTPPETRTAYMESGIWGSATLDAVFRKSAEANPDRVAIADAPNRREWTGGQPRTLTYAEAEETVTRLAAVFRHLGLGPDRILATMMPNVAETVLTVLAAWRCGMIVMPLPLTWRRHSIKPHLERFGVAAIATTDRLEDEDLGTTMRDVAAEIFGIRHILGFGDALADGIIDLDRIMNEFGPESEAGDVHRQESAADHIATLTLTARADGVLVPVPRSHNQWIAAGLMPLLEGRMETGASLLSPFALTGLSGIGTGLVPWLLSSGTLHLHHFTTLDALAAHGIESEAGHILMPGAIAAPLAERLDRSGADANLFVVWPGLHPASTHETAPNAGIRAVIDVTVLDELALVARRRDEQSTPIPLPLGSVAAPSGGEQSLTLAELSVAEGNPPADAAGRKVLGVRGPMTPALQGLRDTETVPADRDGFLETTILADIRPGEPGEAVPRRRTGGLVMVGGLPVGADEMQDAYSGHDAVRQSRIRLVSNGETVPGLDLAVVPEHAAPFSRDDATRYAIRAGLATHVQPRTLTREAVLDPSAEGAETDSPG